MIELSVSMRAARVNANLNLEDAAKAIGITKNTLMGYESGKVSPRVDTAKKMAEVYGLPIEEINFFAM